MEVAIFTSGGGFLPAAIAASFNNRSQLEKLLSAGKID